MIKTKQPIIYEDRGEKSSILEIEIHSFSTDKTGITYLVHDFVYIDGVKTIYKAKNVFYPNAQIDGLDEYISANHDFTGLSKTETEWKKLQIGLMLDTQTNLFESGKTIYRLLPNDWEFTA